MGSAARFGKFKWSRAGYAAVMNSPSVQLVIERKARAVRKAADAMLSDDDLPDPPHVVRPVQGALARGKVVRTNNVHARNAQAREKTLTKALYSARGA